MQSFTPATTGAPIIPGQPTFECLPDSAGVVRSHIAAHDTAAAAATRDRARALAVASTDPAAALDLLEAAQRHDRDAGHYLTLAHDAFARL